MSREIPTLDTPGVFLMLMIGRETYTVLLRTDDSAELAFDPAARRFSVPPRMTAWTMLREMLEATLAKGGSHAT